MSFSSICLILCRLDNAWRNNEDDTFKEKVGRVSVREISRHCQRTSSCRFIRVCRSSFTRNAIKIKYSLCTRNYTLIKHETVKKSIVDSSMICKGGKPENQASHPSVLYITVVEWRVKSRRILRPSCSPVYSLLWRRQPYAILGSTIPVPSCESYWSQFLCSSFKCGKIQCAVELYRRKYLLWSGFGR